MPKAAQVCHRNQTCWPTEWNRRPRSQLMTTAGLQPGCQKHALVERYALQKMALEQLGIQRCKNETRFISFTQCVYTYTYVYANGSMAFM